MLFIMNLNAKSALATSLNRGRSDRGIVSTYSAIFDIELGFLNKVYRKSRLGAFYSRLTILFVYMFGCHVIHLKTHWRMRGNLFP